VTIAPGKGSVFMVRLPAGRRTDQKGFGLSVIRMTDYEQVAYGSHGLRVLPLLGVKPPSLKGGGARRFRYKMTHLGSRATYSAVMQYNVLTRV
jgi:hypothetical protein